MKHIVNLMVIVGLATACAPVVQDVAAPPPAARSDSVTPPPPPLTARTVEEFDTTSEADRAAASAPAGGGRLLGSDIASLGDPTDPGFWIESTLVTEPGRGRVVLAGTSASVEVDLIPGTGGSRMSLPALRVLGVGLTDLPTVEVYAF